MIAPAGVIIERNHNETLLADEIALNVKVLEEVIAPALAGNHNEAVLADEVVLTTQPLEEVIAPAGVVQN